MTIKLVAVASMQIAMRGNVHKRSFAFKNVQDFFSRLAVKRGDVERRKLRVLITPVMVQRVVVSAVRDDPRHLSFAMFIRPVIVAAWFQQLGLVAGQHGAFHVFTRARAQAFAAGRSCTLEQSQGKQSH